MNDFIKFIYSVCCVSVQKQVQSEKNIVPTPVLLSHHCYIIFLSLICRSLQICRTLQIRVRKIKRLSRKLSLSCYGTINEDQFPSCNSTALNSCSEPVLVSLCLTHSSLSFSESLSLSVIQTTLYVLNHAWVIIPSLPTRT